MLIQQWTFLIWKPVTFPVEEHIYAFRTEGNKCFSDVFHNYLHSSWLIHRGEPSVNYSSRPIRNHWLQRPPPSNCHGLLCARNDIILNMLLELKIIKSRYVNSERMERETRMGKITRSRLFSFGKYIYLPLLKSFNSSTPTLLKQINEGIMLTWIASFIFFC